MKELFARLGVQVDTSSFAKADGMINGMRNGLLALTAIGTGVTYALRSIVQGTADQAREIQRTARITGIGAEALQGLNYAAKVSGISAEELQHGLIHLARSAREAAVHGGGAGLAYAQLGIRTANATGKLRPMNDIFREVATKLSRMPDGTQKAALAMSLFGRAGAQLIPLLDQGPAGIAALTEEARKLGIVLDDKALAAANRYRVTLDRLDGAVQGLKNSIAVKLLPVFQRATEHFIHWLSVHRQWIALGIQKAFRDISQVVLGLVQAGKDLFHLFERIWNSSRAGKVLLVALGAAVVGLSAPWLAFMATLALVAEDVEGYFHGKDSITGRIIFALDKMKKRLGDQFGFKAVFTEGLEEAKKFFAFMDQQLARQLGGNGSGNTVADKDSIWEQFKDYLRSSIFQMNNEVRTARGLPPLDPQGDPANVFSGRSAFRSFPGSQYAYQPIGGDLYRVDAKTGAGSGGGPAIFKIDKVEVHADSEAGGRAAAKAFGDGLVKHEDLNRMLREAAAGPMRQ